MLTIATANVNGIRAALKRGMGEWVDTRKPDVLLLQEVRAPEALLGDLLPADRWHLAHAESEAKGRAGVAIASRLPVRAIRINLDQGVATNTGRWVEADLDVPADDDGPSRPLTVISAYLHSGTVGTPSMDEKYAFLDLVTARMAQIAADGGLAVVAGDLNIAHREVDIKNWKGNLKAAGFLPEERAYVDRWLDGQGWRGRRSSSGPSPTTGAGATTRRWSWSTTSSGRDGRGSDGRGAHQRGSDGRGSDERGGFGAHAGRRGADPPRILVAPRELRRVGHADPTCEGQAEGDREGAPHCDELHDEHHVRFIRLRPALRQTGDRRVRAARRREHPRAAGRA